MTCYICWLVIHFKGSSQFLFLLISFTPKKSGASQVCITFLQVTQKILTEDTFHWSLKFWNHWKHFYKFSAWENSHSVFVILPKICQKIEKKSIFLAYFGSWKANYRLFIQPITLHCFSLTLTTVLCMYKTIYPYLFLIFSHFEFLFSLSLSVCVSPRNTFYNLQCFV